MLILEISFKRGVVFTAIKVSLIVGVLLNLINQGNVLLSGAFDQLNWFKIMLTFAVPYLVSTYATVKANLAFRLGTTSYIEAKVECTHCKTERATVKEMEAIPVCPNCMENTNWKQI